MNIKIQDIKDVIKKYKYSKEQLELFTKQYIKETKNTVFSCYISKLDVTVSYKINLTDYWEINIEKVISDNPVINRWISIVDDYNHVMYEEYINESTEFKETIECLDFLFKEVSGDFDFEDI